MKLRFSLLLLYGSLAASSQTTSSPGIAPAWDVRATIEKLVAQADRYKAAVDVLRTPDWVAQGAPQTYSSQQRTVQAEAGYLRQVAARAAANPEKLSLVLETYFRLQNLETFTISLAEGAERYQNPEASSRLHALLAENYETRYKLRQYLLDLSAAKEQEQAAAEREAQRCMSEMSRPAAPASQGKKND